MTFPTIPTVAAGRLLVANQLDTTATRTFPDLSGLTKNSGDLLIAIVVAYETSTGTDAAFSGWTGGFTEFHDSATSTTMAIGCAYKWSTGSETGTFAVTQAATITGDASFILLSIPGAHDSTPPEAGSRASGTSAAADPSSFNPAGWDAEDTLWISVVGSGMTSGTGSWTATGTTAPTNYTNRVDTNASDTSTIGDCEAAVAFRQLNAASEDVGTAGVDTSNARNSAIVIAVRPSAAVNATPEPAVIATTSTLPAPAVDVVAGQTAIASVSTLPQPEVNVVAGQTAIATSTSLPQATPVIGGGDVTAEPAVAPTTTGMDRADVNVVAGQTVVATSSTIPQPAVDVVAGQVAATTTTTLPRADVNVVAGQTALPTTTTLPQPAVDVVASPAVIATVAALPAPTVLIGGDIVASPTTVATTATLPRADVNVVAGQTVVATAAALPVVSIATGTTASPAAVATLTTLPSANVVAEGVGGGGMAHGPLPVVPGYGGPPSTLSIPGGIT